MLEVRSLTKYYNHTAAVRDVSFTIRPGEVLGYLGSNGAGKSTTVKMLTGLITPSDGSILFDGASVHDDLPGFQRRMGYVPEEAHLYPHLSGREYLQLVGRLRGMPHTILEPRTDEFLQLFSLWDDRHDPISSYSKGMRQKILLSAALLHNPDLLILDEPFSGLDVTSALVLRNLLRKLAEQGKMILFSSHVLDVVEKVCTKVLILRKGEVAAYDSINSLQRLMSQPSLEGVFAQLTQVADTATLADQLVDAMSLGEPKASRPLADAQPKPVALGLRAYRRLARAFPQEFTNVYGDELLDTTESAVEPIWKRHGLWGLCRLLGDFAFRAGLEHVSELRQDVQYGIRSLVRSPGFSIVALISLTLGIAIATCAFSEMNGMALRSLPVVQDPGALVAIQAPTSYPAYKRFGDQPDLFVSTMAYAAPVPFGVSVTNGSTERSWGHLVSPTYFSTLGVHPAAGSLFDGGNDAHQVVISYRFWRDHLGKEAAAIGRTVRINGHPCLITGVAPDDFLGASPLLFPADLWMPVATAKDLTPELADNALERRDHSMFFVVGRLKNAVSLESAEAALDTVARQFDADQIQFNSARKDRRVTLVQGGRMLPLRKQDVPFFTSFLTIMAVLIMTIACANVANMMLARDTRRRREIAIRLSLGASRSRLVRQLLTESTVIAFAAGVLGYATAAWLMSLSSQMRMPFPMPVAYDFRPDGHVLLWTAALSLAAGIVFGLGPALQATRPDVAPAMKQGGDVSMVAHRRFSFRNLLIVSQVAGSLTLLVALGVLSLGIQTTLGIQAGFNPDRLYAIALDPVRDGLSAAQTESFFDRLMIRVRTLPSVAAAGLTETVPVSMPASTVMVSEPHGKSLTVRTIRHVVGNNYFETAGIRLRTGRPFRDEDSRAAATTVIVSEALPRALWDRGEPLGRTIEIRNGEASAPKILPGPFDYRPAIRDGVQTFQVVGVADDVAEGLTVGKPKPAVYFPLRPRDYSHPPLQGITLLLRGTPGADVLAEVRREISTIDAKVTPFNARRMDAQIDQFMAPLRIAVWTYGLVGVFGVVLACVGIAGVTGYSVAHRSREIGIRMALGARSRQVLALVMKEGLLLVLAGSVVGMAGAWSITRFLAAMNSSVQTVSSTSSSDPVVLVGAPLLLAAIGALACYLPARRSTRVNPVVALRQE